MKALGDCVSALGQRASRHGAAHLLEEGVLIADQHLGQSQPLQCGSERPAQRKRMRRRLISILAALFVAALLALTAEVASIAPDIRRQSTVDEVQPADVILVL